MVHEADAPARTAHQGEVWLSLVALHRRLRLRPIAVWATIHIKGLYSRGKATKAAIQDALSRASPREGMLGMLETSVARRKYLTTQMQEHWGDGRSRLWNPPFDLLPLVVRKIIADGGTGVLVAPHWPAQAWHAQLVAHATNYEVLRVSTPNSQLLQRGLIRASWLLYTEPS